MSTEVRIVVEIGGEHKPGKWYILGVNLVPNG